MKANTTVFLHKNASNIYYTNMVTKPLTQWGKSNMKIEERCKASQKIFNFEGGQEENCPFGI